MKKKLLFLIAAVSFGAMSLHAQETGLLTNVGSTISAPQEPVSYVPEVYGAVKAKFELGLYDGEHRFNVRNSRIGVRGNVSQSMKYVIQIDFNNEGKVSILDSYATLFHGGFEFSLGQQQYRFLTDLDRGPNTSFFANRSFIAKFLTTYYEKTPNNSYVKTIGSRDIGAMARYKLANAPLRFTLGAFNGAGTNNPEWSNSISVVARADIGNSKKGLSGAVSHYNGHSPAVYYDYNGCVQDETCEYVERRQKFVMWGGELTYAQKNYRIEAQYAQRRLTCDQFDLLHAGLVQGFYQFALPKSSFADYVSPLLRWDIGQDIEYMNVSKQSISSFSAQRVTVGLNLGFVSKIITSEVRLNYEKYLFNHKPLDYNANKLFHDKITIELIAAF